MRPEPNRPINDDEVRIIRIALQCCAENPEAAALVPTLDNLRVVSGCECGCASVDFARSSSERPTPIAEAVGILGNREDVGIIIWGTPVTVTGLEIYDLTASATNLPLSAIASIVPWDKRAA
jgi:hypothetical protein